jgi:hypothetical protein
MAIHIKDSGNLLRNGGKSMKHIKLWVVFTLIIFYGASYATDAQPLPKDLSAAIENANNTQFSIEGQTLPNFQPQTGLWWNPKRSGHGMDIHTSGSRLFMVWYTYDNNGLPVWYLASGEFAGKAWSAPLYRFVYDKASNTTTPILVGSVTLGFFDRQVATISWDINGSTGFEPIETFLVGKRPVFSPLTGMYFDPNDPGWGITVNVQDNTMVVVSYIYDEDGQGRWVLGSKSDVVVDEPGSIAVDMLFFSNGFEPNELASELINQPMGSVEVIFEESFGVATVQRNATLKSVQSPTINTINNTDTEIGIAINRLALGITGSIDTTDKTDSIVIDFIRNSEASDSSSLRLSSAPFLFIDTIQGSEFVPLNANITYQANLSISEVKLSNIRYSWNVVNYNGANAFITSDNKSVSLATGTTFGSVNIQVFATDTISGLNSFKSDKWVHILRGSELDVDVYIEGNTRLQLGRLGEWTARAFGGLPPYRFDWAFDDGGAEQGRNVSHVFETEETTNRQVTVTVTDAAGDKASSILPVTIETPPLRVTLRGPSEVTVSSSSFDIYGVTHNKKLKLGSREFFTYLWESDGIGIVGCEIEDQFCSLRWTSGAQGFVSVKVKSFLGEDADSKIKVELKNSVKPVSVEILEAPSTLLENLEGMWTIIPSGGTPPYVVEFDWGDSSHEDPFTAKGLVSSRSHAYTQAGSYTVTITVTDQNNASVSPSRRVTVAAPEIPLSASISSAPDQLEVNERGDWAVTANGGVPPYKIKFLWGNDTFDTVPRVENNTDNAIAVGIIQRHSYTETGNFTVKIEVTDSTKKTVHTDPRNIEITNSSGSPTISGKYTWDAACGSLGNFNGTLTIGIVAADGAFSGSFGPESGGGTMSNGRVFNGHIEFDRILFGRSQNWRATINGSSIGVFTVTDPTGNCTARLERDV